MSVKDPCTGVCRFDRRSGWCLGCARTAPEIRAWRKMQPHARGAVERDAASRRKRLAARGKENDA